MPPYRVLQQIGYHDYTQLEYQLNFADTERLNVI
jgi:hypothetical protein